MSLGNAGLKFVLKPKTVKSNLLFLHYMRGKGIKFEAQTHEIEIYLPRKSELPFHIHAYLPDEIDQLEFIFKNNKKNINMYIVESIICERHCG